MEFHGRIVTVDIAVIGAGAAGLAAARSLHDRSVDVLLLEAHGHIGGRAYTLTTRDGAYPIELGAEFIHGQARATMDLLRECGSGTSPIAERESDIWESTERVLDRVDVNGRDTSVDAFLKNLDVPEAAQARMLIEGFDAALTADASIIAIAKEWRSTANDTQGRPRAGYGVIMEHLARPLGDRLWLNTVVLEIEWSPEGVELLVIRSGESLRIRARRAIVTLPVGVLRENIVKFIPGLPAEKRFAVEDIGMGPVVKVLLEFRSVFWSDGFFETPDGSPFATLWSRMPQPAPVLAAWAGGDAAVRLLERFRDPVGAAIDTCARVFPSVDVRSELVDAHIHDWQRDACSRGAYSYLRVNGGDARQRLGQAIGGVLFFAGEATSPEDAGTVAGAFASGYRAADEVLRLRSAP